MVSLPQISVIIPSYNYACFLESAIDSVLQQSYQHFEIIAWDDGSGDDSLPILRRYAAQHPERFRYFQHEGGQNKGIAATYRAAVAQAKGTWIAFLEADDVWHKENLSLKAEALKKSAEAGVVFSECRPFGQMSGVLYWKLHAWLNQSFLPRYQPIDLTAELLQRNPVASFSNFMVRKDLFDQVPDPQNRILFYDWWVLAHVSLSAPFCFVPKKLCDWRIHSQSANYRKESAQSVMGLKNFLENMLDSMRLELENAGECAGTDILSKKKKIIRHLDFYRSFEIQRAGSWFFAFLTHPWETIRFAGHFLLRNLLF
ncbi:MAG TPA: glycosyltransferase [Candidatus Omnitrophota bacterium]|nr:hypothetical protein [Candidatus Omnitrophota bacterium]HRK62111.1 glycosyltransferase [Candidatus Omnitrophota bacterium]